MKRVVGALEVVSLPELQLIDISAKVDTGADSSALHCTILSVQKDSVTFRLLDEEHPLYDGNEYTFPIAAKKHVKSSNGITSERVFIETTIQLSGFEKKSLISLTDRADMKHAMLLGKRFLKHDFLVDVSANFLEGVPL